MEIIHYHSCNFERHGIFKAPQIKTGPLLDLLQTIDQGIPVHMKLTGSFCNIQIVLKKAVYRKRRLFVKAIGNFLTKNLRKKAFA